MGEPKIVVVDYHKGNLSSVVRGLARAGAAACTSDDPEQIRDADGLVIPGVGAFYDAIAFMRQSGEADAVLGAVVAGTPLLGICLGLQLFFERGNEGVPTDEGADADLAVLDLNRPHMIDSGTFRSLGRATPFDGWGVSAAVAMTICGGEIAFGDVRNEQEDV